MAVLVAVLMCDVTLIPVIVFVLSGSVDTRLAVSRKTSYPKDVLSGLMDSSCRCL